VPVAQRREGDAELALAVAERPELVRDPLRPLLVKVKRLEAMTEVCKLESHSKQQRHPHQSLRLEGRGPLRRDCSSVAVLSSQSAKGRDDVDVPLQVGREDHIDNELSAEFPIVSWHCAEEVERRRREQCECRVQVVTLDATRLPVVMTPLALTVPTTPANIPSLMLATESCPLIGLNVF
jgi:hypothetical protein